MRSRSLRPVSLSAIAISVALAGCGQASREDVLSQAAHNLGTVRSGNLDLRMAVTGGDASQSGQVGFEERGPFALPATGALPVARTEVIHFVGSTQDTTTFTSTGREAFITTNGQAFALPAAQVQALKRASTPTSGNLAGLPIDRWAAGGTSSDGGQVDGVSTDHVSAAVDVRQFLNDLMQLSRGLGQTASVPQLSQADAQTLSHSVRSSHFDMWAGRDDHELRKLRVSVDFAAPSDPAGGLAKYSRSHLELDLDLASVNQPVTVSAPANAQPFSAFCARQPDTVACKSAQS